jgi:hypothetical protein
MSSISFACPECQGPTEVRDSRPRMEEGGIRRRRHCADCGHRFTTWEVQAGDIDALMSGVQNAPPEVYRQVKEMASLLAGLSGDDRLILMSLARRLGGGGVSSRLYEVADRLGAAA